MLISALNLARPPSSGVAELQGSFAGLMDLYERSYIGLRRLIPNLPPAGTHQTSRVGEGLDLHLQVVERFPYTAEVLLTYYFSSPSGTWAEPNVRIRIYQDAQQAEVMAAHLRHWPVFEASALQERQHLAARWHVNRFLCKWLNYCLYQGHRFG